MNETQPLDFRDHHGQVTERLAGADGLLFCADFDGTLAEITDDPDAPEPRAKSKDRLSELAEGENVRVAVVSGRALSDLRERVGLAGIEYAGNHGLELYYDGERHVHPEAKKRVDVLDEICAELEARLDAIDGAIIENKTLSATVHYRNVDREDLEYVKEATREVLEAHAPELFELSEGKAVTELHPTIERDKGEAVRLLADRLEGDWLVSYIGDDTTDETAFRAIGSEGLTIHVGDGETTSARYRVPDPEAVEELLSWFSEDGLEALARGR